MMDDLWSRLTALLRRDRQRPRSQPFIDEHISDPLISVEEVSMWTRSLPYRRLADDIRESLAMWQSGRDQSTLSIQYVERDSWFGLVVYCCDMSALAHRDYLTLIEHWRSQATELGYIKQVGDIKSRNRGSQVERTYRYYLKPSLRYLTGPKANQLYGNLTFSYIVLDDLPTYVKITVTTYSDAKYLEPRGYDELMKALFD